MPPERLGIKNAERRRLGGGGAGGGVSADRQDAGWTGHGQADTPEADGASEGDEGDKGVRDSRCELLGSGDG